MGVNLRELASPAETEMESLSGKVVAIDALNIIYQFLSTIRDRFTGEPLKDSSGSVTSHLSGLFYRTARMMEGGITPVFIFDGKPPEFKQGTQDERRKIREEARVKWEAALRAGDTEKVRIFSQQAVSVDSAMLDEAKRLLGAMGVQCVEAASEGEAQASVMCSRGQAYACGSQDWDCLLFGATRLVRNLAVSGRRKLPGKETYVKVNPEIVELGRMLSSLGIDREKLVTIGILVGTDYNPGGVRGIGPKKALEMVREKGSFDAVMKDVPWEFGTSAETIFRFFMEPPAREVELSPGIPDATRITQILQSHDFSEERISRTLEKLMGARDKRKQSSLSSFF